jgi:outer membrane autotransporter protein
MTTKARLACATSTLALILFTPTAAYADPEPASAPAVVALPTPVNMNVSAWSVDRRAAAGFANTVFEGRDTIKIHIAPPSTGQSFTDWQGYKIETDGPVGNGSLRGDLWINSNWTEGSAEDYIRTGIWGSLVPEGSTQYVNASAIFPIISFTNQDGQGRLEVWDNDASATGWVDLGVDTANLLNFGGWNRFEARVIGSDKIDYVVNGQTVYTWEMPRGVDDSISEELWALYLKPRNNGQTTFDTYWSDLTTSDLILDGGTIAAAPNGIEVLSGGVGTVTIAQGVQAKGVTTGQNSQATLAFGLDSGVQTSAAGAHGVVSSEGSPLSLQGGTVTTSGANAHGLLATGEGSQILTVDTAVLVTGTGSYGASVTNGGAITLSGGSVEASKRALSAVGGSITATNTAIRNVVATNNNSETGAAYALNGGSITLTGGTVDVAGGRNSGLLALAGGAIDATDVAITASGDRVRGAYAGGDTQGAGTIILSGGSITTNGQLSHGLFAKRETGSTGEAVATIEASNVAITVNGTDANGIYADAGGAITVTGGSVTTLGSKGVALHAQATDDGVTGAGILVASNLTVSTAGGNAYGGYAEKGGQLTINGGTINTTGSRAYGLYARDDGSRITSSADISTGADVEWTFGAYATKGATIDLTGGTVTTNGFRGHGLLADQGATITSAADVVTHGDRAHGVQAGATSGLGATITLSDIGVTTTGSMAYGLLAYNGSSISGTANISTAGEGSFGVSADGGGTIILTGGSVVTTGAGSHALQSVRDDRFAEAGILSASAINVSTSGANAFGALADEGGSVTLTGGALATSGEGSHGLVASGPAHLFDRSIDPGSVLTATDIAVQTTGANAAGAAIIGQGEINLTGGSISASGPALLAETAADASATFSISGTTLSSATGSLLLVDRTDDVLGEGTVNLTLSNGAQATGDISDLSEKTSGTTNVTIDGSRLDGAIAGVDSLILSGGATWAATGAGPIGAIFIGENGATISTAANVLLDSSLSGSDNLIKAGTGRLTLAGDGADYSGTTGINGGTLALTGSLGGNAAIGAGGTFDIGSGGTSGDFAGDVANDGILLLSRSDDSRFSGRLSGTGSLLKTGAGALTFSGDGTAFAGLTTLSEGSFLLQSALGGNAAVGAGTTFQIGVDDGPASFQGDLANNGTVIFAQPVDYAYAGKLSGAGTLTKGGATTLSLTGDSAAYSGTTNVSAGRLLLTGTLGGNAVVAQGATFQIGDNNASGSLLGSIRTDGNLLFARTDNHGYGGAITGTGTVLKTGGGQLTYAGNGSAFTGTTTVSAGRLLLTGSLGGTAIVSQGAALALDGGSLTANLANAGTFAIGGASGTTYAGTLTGAGALTKDGTGTFRLTGNGAGFTGSTTVSGGSLLLTGSLAGTVLINTAGTLQVGDGQTNGDLTASTTNNGTMIFDQVGDYDYAGALAGNGSLVKRGTGILLLSGNYGYTGATVVEGGRIKLTSQLDEQTELVVSGGTMDLTDKVQEVASLSGGEAGTLVLGNTGQLTVKQETDTTFAGTFEGGGTMIKSGIGTLDLRGNSVYDMNFFIDIGKLKFNGLFSASHVVVTDGAIIGGSGTIGQLGASSGGTVAPGNSIGTLHVTGNVTFDAGSIYEVEVDAAGNSDKIIASGSAQINGAKVSVLAAAGNYRWSTDYSILTAAGGVNGRFNGTTINLPFLDPLLSYSPTSVTLTLVRNDRTFASVAGTRNQRAVALALDTGSHNGGLYRAISAQTDASGAVRAFDALSGELWATTDTLVIDQSRRIGELALGRLQQADTISHALSSARSASTQDRSGTAIWGQALGSWNKLKGDGNASRATQHQYGFVTGLDTGLGDWRIGAAFSHGQNKVEIAARGDRGTVTNSTALAYAGGGWGDLRIRVGASYGWYKIDGARIVEFPNYRDQLTGSHRGRSSTVFGELSYAAQLGSVLAEPFAGLNYVHLKTKGFTEAGGGAALVANGAERDVSFSTVGLRLGAVVPISDEAAITPRISAAWLHGFGDRAAEGDYALLNGQAFTVVGLPVARNSAAIEAGAQVNILPGGSLGISYVGNLSERWKDHGLKLGFSYSF